MKKVIQYFRDLLQALYDIRHELQNLRGAEETTNAYLHDIRAILDTDFRVCHGGYRTPAFRAS